MSEGIDDERDAAPTMPRYGEYASPEEQQERIRISGAPSAVLTPNAGVGQPSTGNPVDRSRPVDPSWPAPLVERRDIPEESARAGDQADGQPRRRRDRFVTLGLLAYGLFTVGTSLPQLIEYGEFAQLWLDMAGIDATFTAYGQGRLWGSIAACIFAFGWLASALWAWRTAARGRISWWIPIVGAVVTFTLASICLSVPLFNDPSIMEALLRGQ